MVVNIDVIFSIQANQITDRNNYHTHVQDGKTWFLYILNIGFPLFFFSEPFSKFIYFVLYIFFSNEQLAVKFLIFFQLFSTFYLIRKNSNLSTFWILILMLTPPVLVNYIMTIRQGLASLFFLFFFYGISNKKYIWLFFSPFIHFLFYGVLAIFYLSTINFFKSKPILSIFLFLVFTFSFSLIASKLISYFNLSYFEFDSVNFRIGFQFIYWLIILLLFIFQGNYFLKNNFFVCLIITFYLGSVLVVPHLSRVLDSLAILIFLSGFQLTGRKLIVYKGFVFSFSFYQIFMFISNGNIGNMMLNE
jgi:hypothetical protein